MAKFIAIKKENEELLLNVENIISISPYQADYSKDEIKGVMIKCIGDQQSVLYTNVDFENLKSLLINK